ncbi:MAG TPA: hypothetical protein PKA27_02360 [Fimbriimonadaceae bacterium]|nr:hypothetical protein [Fimbriimonadaceae bacterium]
MAFPFVPALLGIAGLAMQSEASRKAGNAEAEARAQQASIYERRRKLFDTLFGAVEGADNAGFFDPTKRIAALREFDRQDEALETGNTAAGLRVAGYRPGDSEIGQRLDAVSVKHKRNRDELTLDETRRSFFDKIGAYSSVNASLLDPELAGSESRISQARSSQGGFGTLLSSLMPFLEDRKEQKPSSRAAFNLGQTASGMQRAFGW